MSLAALLTWTCTRRVPRDAGKEHRYALDGVVVELDPKSTLAVIKHGPIRDTKGKTWMEAMTMEFPVKEAAEWAKLKTGLHIRATVFQRESDYEYWLGEIQVMPKQ